MLVDAHVHNTRISAYLFMFMYTILYAYVHCRCEHNTRMLVDAHVRRRIHVNTTRVCLLMRMYAIRVSPRMFVDVTVHKTCIFIVDVHVYNSRMFMHTCTHMYTYVNVCTRCSHVYIREHVLQMYNHVPGKKREGKEGGEQRQPCMHESIKYLREFPILTLHVDQYDRGRRSGSDVLGSTIQLHNPIKSDPKRRPKNPLPAAAGKGPQACSVPHGACWCACEEEDTCEHNTRMLVDAHVRDTRRPPGVFRSPWWGKKSPRKARFSLDLFVRTLKRGGPSDGPPRSPFQSICVVSGTGGNNLWHFAAPRPAKEKIPRSSFCASKINVR
jgi:hypothetical protein